MSAGSQEGTAPQEALTRLARQFLVHSFLYYRLDESLIGDQAFDALTENLRALHASHPELTLPHARVLAPALGPEASGFSIRQYPPDILTAAFKLLYRERGSGVEFGEFVERRGYSIGWETP